MNKGLFLYLSNDLNILFDNLYKNFKVSSQTPFFQKNWIVVQTDGMVRWVSLKFAERDGIFGNTDFLFPKNFILKVLEVLKILDVAKIRFDKKGVCLDILKYLQHNNIEELTKYIDDWAGKKSVQLALKLADIFDQYVIYRPEFVKNPDKISVKWQKKIFKQVIYDKPNIINGIEKFLDGSFDKSLLDLLPQEINLFSISILPPVFVSFIKKLSEYKKINIYTINPCKSFWFDDLSDKAKVYFENRYGKSDFITNDGNPILLNNGKMLQDFISLLYETEPTPIEYENYSEIDVSNNLNELKKSILYNVKGIEKVNDKTVQIHSYHSKLREVEGLYNYILNIIENDNEVCLEDVVVMCSDINDYAPFIEAVFKDKGVKYNISDNKYLNDDLGIKTIFQILNLLKNDINALDFIDLLENEVIKSKFNFTPSEIETINNLVKTLNLRWGLLVDELKTKYENISPYNTFEYFYNRLITGIFNKTEEILYGVLPYRDLTLSQADLIGKLLFIINKIKFYYINFQNKISFNRAKELLFNIIEDFISKDYSNSAPFITFIKELEDIEDDEIFIKLDGFIEFLKAVSDDVKNTHNFMRGGITFCELVPLRSIPFKVVCLLGMSDENFPRADRKLFINELELYKKRGDRNRKLSDRLLFLDTIISSDKYLYISFIGRDLKRNKIITPSLPVSELIDFLGLQIIEHPLHSFSRRYFYKNSMLINYNFQDYKIVKNDNLLEHRKDNIVFCSIKNDNKKSYEKLSLSKFLWFFKNPLRFYFNENFLDLEEKTDIIETKEPLLLDNYTEQRVLLEALKDEQYLEKLKFIGSLPHGSIGKRYINIFQRNLRWLEERLEKIFNGATFDSLEETEITYSINDEFYIDGKIRYFINGNLIFIYLQDVLKNNKYSLEWVIKSALSNRDFFILLYGDGVKKGGVNIKSNFLKELFEIYRLGKTYPLIFDEKIMEYGYEEFLNYLQKTLNQKRYSFVADHDFKFFVENFVIDEKYFTLLKDVNSKLYDFEVYFEDF